ncbi:pro-resilin-like [Prorops nasuta]|uniref:pro-resilin-like n=1 Tax=Prorops nasuta TaxID=863751 RepID=UPI0034CE817F
MRVRASYINKTTNELYCQASNRPTIFDCFIMTVINNKFLESFKLFIKAIHECPLPNHTSLLSTTLAHFSFHLQILIVAALTALATNVLARPEPPVSQYLPPSQQYRPPQGFGNNINNNYQQDSFNNQYLPPNQDYASSSHQFTAPNQQYGATGGGYGDYDAPARYEFEYSVNDFESSNDFGHKESRDGDIARGVYYVLLPDGRRQTVEYEADSHGFRPRITYTQESTGNRNGYSNGYNNGYSNGYNNGYRY